MQLDMNELILQAPLSLGAVYPPQKGCEFPKKAGGIFSYGWVWEVWFAYFFWVGWDACFFFVGCCETLHVQETKPREEPPVFEQSG